MGRRGRALSASALPPGGTGRAAPVPALQVESLSFAYAGTPALDAVSLTVPRGRFAALVGANGAGKTTLFSIVTGLFSAGGGRVDITGHDLARRPRAALSALGVVFQKPTLDNDLSVRQNLSYFADLHGLSRTVARERIAEALVRHGVADVQRRKAGALSGGQRRRVELARALLHRPALLLMDEPTVGLDIASRAAFVDHVRALADDGEVGVLWATHLIDEIRETDPVHMLERGRLLASGPLRELLDEHRVGDVAQLARLLGARPPRPDGERA